MALIQGWVINSPLIIIITIIKADGECNLLVYGLWMTCNWSTSEPTSRLRNDTGRSSRSFMLACCTSTHIPQLTAIQ